MAGLEKLGNAVGSPNSEKNFTQLKFLMSGGGLDGLREDERYGRFA
jgi:hypothetical protein